MDDANSYIDRFFELLLQSFELKESGLTILEDSLWFLDKIMEKNINQEEKDAFSLIRQAVKSWTQSIKIRRKLGKVTSYSPLETTYWRKAAEIFSTLKNEKLAELTLAINKLREAENSLMVDDPERAISSYYEAEEKLEKLEKKAAITAKRRRLNIQAEILFTKQEFQKAAELYFQIAEILEKTGHQAKEPALIRAHELLVLHEGSKENWKKVSEHQTEIAKLLRNINEEEKALIAEYYAHSASAKSAEEQKDWNTAAENHLKASEILQKIGNPISALYAKLNYHICKEKAERKSPKWLETAEKLVEKARIKNGTKPQELENKAKEILTQIEQEKQTKE
ncbi:MAG: hypothetical protein QW279_16380 [Candidatus Jordarchaeaceae archaeon]